MSPSETEGQSSTGRYVVERPPPGLARGKYPLPAWGIFAIGAVAVLAGLVYVFRRFRERMRR